MLHCWTSGCLPHTRNQIVFHAAPKPRIEHFPRQTATKKTWIPQCQKNEHLKACDQTASTTEIWQDWPRNPDITEARGPAGTKSQCNSSGVWGFQDVRLLPCLHRFWVGISSCRFGVQARRCSGATLRVQALSSQGQCAQSLWLRRKLNMCRPI